MSTDCPLARPLQFEPVVQDTTCNTKALSLIPIDWIQSGLVLLRIPAGQFPPVWINDGFDPFTPYPPLIIAQYNYAVGDPITILNPNDIALDYTLGNTLGFALAIRYRIGTTVFRYLLSKTALSVEGYIPRSSFPFPDYTNQTIYGNFVVELWQFSKTISTNLLKINKDIYLKTGRIYFPCEYGQAGNILDPSQTVLLPELQTALPENLPTTQAAGGPWNTN